MYYCACHRVLGIEAALTPLPTDVHANVYPFPRTVVNRTCAGFKAFTIMLYLFGAAVTCINFGAFRWYYEDFQGGWREPFSGSWRVERRFIDLQHLIIIPIAIFLIVMPALGPLIVNNIVQHVSLTSPSSLRCWLLIDRTYSTCGIIAVRVTPCTQFWMG